MKILLVSATPFEIEPLVQQLRSAGAERTPYHFVTEQHELHVLITGVGLPLAAFALGHRLATSHYDWVLQAGVGGAIDRSLELGQVVEVVSDCFADLGVEEAEGNFTSAIAMGLIEQDGFPFKVGRLWNPAVSERQFLPQVHGISVNKVHGTETSIAAMMKAFPYAQVESMEGAALHYACLQNGVAFAQIRAISNYVEKRNRAGWKLKESIEALNEVLTGMLV